MLSRPDSTSSPHLVICGGGLAGLTLALQLKRRIPRATVTVLEPSRRPLPEAAHKVGESTVEVGARYYGHVLGLRTHLLERQLPKNGLRFFSGPPRSEVSDRTEMGPRESPRVPAYQLDRGRLENDLRARCESEGIDLREGYGVRDVDLNALPGGRHRVIAAPTRKDGDAPLELEADWVIDATGRRRLILKKLKLHVDTPIQASSSWFRVEGRVKVGELVSPEAREWHERDIDQNRWLSTNHLCGEGYWVWLIPLSSGNTSVGIVAEASRHEYRTFSTEETAMQWLEKHEPQLHARLQGVPWIDFIAMKDYRHDAKQVFSEDRWAAVGEAALFVDPLYSPGSDIIGLGNCIVTELIASDLEGRHNPVRIAKMDEFFRDWATLLNRTLCDGSVAMGFPEVFGAKLYWDYFYYWACMCPYFFRELYKLDTKEHERFHAMLKRYAALNERAQGVLRAWTTVSSVETVQPIVGLPAPATTLSDLHLALLEDRDADRTYRDMEEALAWGEELIIEIMLRAMRRAGPERAQSIADAVGLASWPALSQERLAADDAEPRARRKLLSRPVRDMERSIGKNAPSDQDAPRLRELLEIATGSAH